MSVKPLTPGNVVPDRREKFREFMKRFNPAAPAHSAIEQGLIVEEKTRSLYKSIATRSDLEPGSQQLLIGGIGSGKTTELLLASVWLAKQGKSLPLFIDVSQQTDLSKLNSGALLAGLGLAIPGHLKALAAKIEQPAEIRADVKAALEKIKEFAYGMTYQEWISGPDPDDYAPDYPDEYPPDPEYYERDPDYEPGYYRTVKIPPRLHPPFPFPPLDRDIQAALEPLRLMVDAIRDLNVDPIAIFDGLDRLMDAQKFGVVAVQDLRAIRSLGISVVASAPLSLLYGEGRQIADLFDKIHYLPAALADPEQDPFLMQVIERRAGGELLGPKETHELCRGSGGVLRDLIALTRNAAEEAYIEGSESIGLEHVRKAVLQLGQSYFLGLGRTQIQALLKLRNEGSFSAADASRLDLLLSRRVLERPPDQYEVHPALAPLLAEQSPQSR